METHSSSWHFNTSTRNCYPECSKLHLSFLYLSFGRLWCAVVESNSLDRIISVPWFKIFQTPGILEIYQWPCHWLLFSLVLSNIYSDLERKLVNLFFSLVPPSSYFMFQQSLKLCGCAGLMFYPMVILIYYFVNFSNLVFLVSETLPMMAYSDKVQIFIGLGTDRTGLSCFILL